MGDILTDLGDAFNRFAQAGGINTINGLLNPTGSSSGNSTLATNGGSQTVGGIPISASLDPGTKNLLIIFIVAILALILFVALG